MVGSMEDRDNFLAAIEQLGEDTVRARIKAQHWTPKHRHWAFQWLKELESKQRVEAREAAMEERAIRRAMADEARAANHNAATTNSIATIAIIVTIVIAAVGFVFAAAVK